MTVQKPKITRFFSDEFSMGIDWDITLYAFSLSREDGGAIAFTNPPYIQAGIDTDDMRGFRIALDSTIGLAEVFVDVTYHSGTRSLGVTDKIDEAERWVRDANELLRSAKARRRQKQD